MANFRSYRDHASMTYLEGIGFSKKNDRVYPDLVFGLPERMLAYKHDYRNGRVVVGLGLMEYAGRYSIANPKDSIFQQYLEHFVSFVEWLLSRDYDIKLLIGDLRDQRITQEFKSRLKVRLGEYDERRVIDKPALSAEQLLPQLLETDIVVATRFHNILLALLLNRPVIAISFHHKCSSLMSEVGLADYCHDINHMDAGRLIEQFQDMVKNAEALRPMIGRKVEQFRNDLDEQYSVIFKSI